MRQALDAKHSRAYHNVLECEPAFYADMELFNWACKAPLHTIRNRLGMTDPNALCGEPGITADGEGSAPCSELAG